MWQSNVLVYCQPPQRCLQGSAGRSTLSKAAHGGQFEQWVILVHLYTILGSQWVAEGHNKVPNSENRCGSMVYVGLNASGIDRTASGSPILESVKKQQFLPILDKFTTRHLYLLMTGYRCSKFS